MSLSRKFLYFIFVTSGITFVLSGLALFTDIFDEKTGMVYYYPMTQSIEVSTNPVKDAYGAMAERIEEPNYEYHALVEPNDTIIRSINDLARLVNYTCTPQSTPTPTPTPVPPPVGTQAPDWGWLKILVKEAHVITKGKGIKVAVLDTGIQNGHPDLLAPVLSRDFTGSASGANDVAGHGTHVTGIIAAQNNAIGVVGVCPECQIIVGKVLGDNGSGSLNQIAQGVIWATDQGARVINMSLGGPSPSSILDQAIQYAKSKGVQVVVARGNAGTSTPLYPGNSPGVISISATIPTEAKATFSSWGFNGVAYAAPGSNINSTCIGSRYCSMSGTSMASPYAAGVCALALSMGKPNCENLGVFQSPFVYKPETHGKGRVDALKSVQ